MGPRPAKSQELEYYEPDGNRGAGSRRSRRTTWPVGILQMIAQLEENVRAHVGDFEGG